MNFEGLLRRGSAGGYGFIAASSGVFVSHPVDDFVTEEQRLADLNSSFDAGNILLILRTSEEGVIRFDHVDPKSNQESWIFFASIPSTEWLVGLVLDKDEILRSRNIGGLLRWQLIAAAIAAIFTVTFFFVPATGAHRGTVKGLWSVSITFSVLTIAAISYLWFVNMTQSTGGDPRNVRLVEDASTEKVIADLSSEQKDAVLIPTGVFIQSLGFVDSNSILMSAVIWQKYTQDSPNWQFLPEPGSRIPVVFTKADVNYQEEIIEVYRVEESDTVVVGWHVRAVLNQQFDFSEFPFDQEEVFVRMRHPDFGAGVMLTPDLTAYFSTDPEELPGIESDDFFLQGWDIEKSFFSYRGNNYNTDFGVTDAGLRGTSSELYYNMDLSRKFLDPFISHVIPVAVAALLLFAVLVIFSSRRERLGMLGFSASAVLAYCAAIFFVVILQHISLRTTLDAPQGIIYLEYFYFLTYGAILAVSVNAILFASAPNLKILQFRDNLISGISFWPVFLGLFLAFTLIAF